MKQRFRTPRYITAPHPIPTRGKSATVTGSLIKATISGLKAGTTYYVKCQATGASGTTTSETSRVITAY